jgi:F-type H+-transporting ATPase subunit gamma
MAALKTIKTKIRSFEKTRKVTKAMEAVSASKMRKAQNAALSGRAYARAAAAILARVANSRDMQNHPLTRTTGASPEKVLYIVITSDKGLAGALNSAVLRSVYADIADEASVIAIGRKANDFFTKRNVPVHTFYPNTDKIVPEVIYEIIHDSAEEFLSGRVDAVKIAYQNFKSTFEQLPTLRTVFPLSLEELEQVVRDVLPVRGAVIDESQSAAHPQSYTIEPSAEEILNVILPRLASIFVYHALLESQASEHSARMVSMKSASDKAGEMTKGLITQFNKARQANITREVSEITGGMEAMATQ